MKSLADVPVADRLLARRRITESGCWEWTGCNTRGYGRIRLGNRQEGMRLVHREAYRAFVSDIPEEAYVLHHCDNRSCFNPIHLYVGTQQDNMDDMLRRGRYKKGKIYRGENHPTAKLTASDVQTIRSSRLMQKELARMFRVSRAAISLIQSGINWRPEGCPKPSREHPRWRKGENNPGSKLTALAVRIIRRLERPQKEIAKIFSVSEATISRLKTGKLWKEIEQ